MGQWDIGAVGHWGSGALASGAEDLGHEIIVSNLRTLYIYIYIYIYTHTYIHTGCPRRNVPDFGRVFLMLKYTVITQNTYVQS